MDVRCYMVRLKPGSIPQVREWAQTMNSRMSEVLATLHDESVTVESAFLWSAGGHDYLVYYMRSRSAEEARAVASASTHEIDAVHQAFKASVIDDVEPAELLLDAFL